MEVKHVTQAERFFAEKMAKVNLYETPRFFCDLYCLRPGQAQKVHSHKDEDKVYYVLRGRATVTVGDDTRVLNAGDIVLAPAEAPHGVRNDADDEAVCLVFMAPHPGLS